MFTSIRKQTSNIENILILLNISKILKSINPSWIVFFSFILKVGKKNPGSGATSFERFNGYCSFSYFVFICGPLNLLFVAHSFL